MFERIVKRMREKIRTQRYVTTLRAEEEMDNDELTMYEIKRSIFTGVILECQWDWRTAERKYRIRGERPPSSTGETERDGKTNPMKIGVLMVWQKQDGAWRLLARQAVRLEEPRTNWVRQPPKRQQHAWGLFDRAATGLWGMMAAAHASESGHAQAFFKAVVAASRRALSPGTAQLRVPHPPARTAPRSVRRGATPPATCPHAPRPPASP